MKVYRKSERIIELSQTEDPLLLYLYEQVEKIIRKKIGGGVILDVGCGIGQLSLRLAKRGYKVVGVDKERRVIKIAKKNSKGWRDIKFICEDFEKIKFEAESFDAIICSEVIEHVPNSAKLIEKMRRVLKIGGFLVLTTPCGMKNWTLLDEYADHKKRFESDEIDNLLKNFTVEKKITVGFPIMIVIFKIYHWYMEKKELKHDASWRDKKVLGLFYKNSVLFFLKIESLFNRLPYGTNWIVLARK